MVIEIDLCFGEGGGGDLDLGVGLVDVGLICGNLGCK